MRYVWRLAITFSCLVLSGCPVSRVDDGYAPGMPSPTPTPTDAPSVTPTATPTPAPTGFFQITPSTVTVLSETSIKLAWTPPSGIAVLSWSAVVSTSPSAAPTQAVAMAGDGTITGLAPGSVGQIVIVGVTADDTIQTIASAKRYWTPYGALNQDSVSGVRMLGGTAAGIYAEAGYFSPNFSMMFQHAYLPDTSYIFAGIPSSPTQAPLFNFAGGVMQYANDFSFGGGFPSVLDINQITSDGTGKVALVQWSRNRVVLYDALPTSPATINPSRILGQSSWTTTAGGTGASGLNLPTGVCWNGTTLYVADTQNHRIVGYHGWPSQMGQAADFVLGQTNLATMGGCNAGGISKGTLCFPANLACEGGMLAVVDYQGGWGGNQRVLLWNAAPTSNVPADIVIGQSNGTANAAYGAGGIAVGGLSNPAGVAFVPNGPGNWAVIVSDGGSNRVLQWSSPPAADGAPYDLVYGQATNNATAANPGGLTYSGFNGPSGLSHEKDSNRFWVADFSNARWLRFQLNTTTAIGSYGQTPNHNDDYLPGNYSTTRGTWSQWGRQGNYCDPTSGIYVGARNWFAAPANGNVPADFLQGLSNYTSAVGNPAGPTSIGGPFTIVHLNGRAYWSDANRIVSAPGTFHASNVAGDIVLGNLDLNRTVVAAATNDYAINPTQLATDGTVLLAADGPRIVGYSSGTALTTSNHAIELAIGQNDLTTRAANGPGTNAKSLSSVSQMIIHNGKLIVADNGNHRVMIWNTVPTASGVAANVILGQPDVTTVTTGTTLAKMNAPGGVAVVGGKLIVSDTGNNRLLIWSSIPTVTGTAADSSWDTRERFGLPSYFNSQMLSAGRIESCAGRVYLGQYDRTLVIPDLF